MDPSRTAENPFSARHVRPGGIPYIFPTDQNVEMLVERLRQNGWRGEIVGPHGSGKSTLLETLTAALERAGRSVVMIALHDGQRRLPREPLSTLRLGSPVSLIIDGYEQLGYWSRWTLQRFYRRHGVGLLVTAHASVGFPTLYQTTITPELAEQVVEKLLGGRTSPFSTAVVSQCLSKHDGDLRETLFELYDIFEQNRPS
jgi:hypothetical protein